MATEITDGVSVLTPAMVLGWEQSSASRTAIHELLASPYPDVTLRPSASRTGTLELLCMDESQAIQLEALHVVGTVLTISDPDAATPNMSYVVSGPVMRRLDEGTRRRWIVSAPYREVMP